MSTVTNINDKRKENSIFCMDEVKQMAKDGKLRGFAMITIEENGLFRVWYDYPSEDRILVLGGLTKLTNEIASL